MHTQQLHQQPGQHELFSGTSPVSGDRNSDGSNGVHKAGQNSHYLENVDHFYDDDVSYHHRYF